MKNKDVIIEHLNQAITVERTLALQCEHQALTVRGLWRATYHDFFMGLADEARDHARKFGQKVVGLGGNPAVALGEVHEAQDVFDMLELDLVLERKALEVYATTLKLAEDDTALRNMLEDHIEDETLHIEELERVSQRPAEAREPLRSVG